MLITVPMIVVIRFTGAAGLKVRALQQIERTISAILVESYY
jgi:hypothetical protein